MTTEASPSVTNKALDDALIAIHKKFGKESVRAPGDHSMAKIESRSTGSLPLDIALGIGGVPVGRLVEIFGPESSGKTTMCYHMIAECQKKGGLAAFIDTEHAMDANYAAKIGVDFDRLVVSQPDYGEQALDIAHTLVKSGAVHLIVIDSVAALTPKVEVEGSIGDQSMGLLARMMSQGCRMLAGPAQQTGTTIVFTNQIREKIGVMFGSPETQPGGRALKFYCTQRLDIRRIETIKDGSESVANKVRVKVLKNKVAPPFTQAEFNIVFGEGVDVAGSIVDMATDDKMPGYTEGLIAKSGSFFKFLTADEHQVQGKASAAKYLNENPELKADLYKKIFDANQPEIDEDFVEEEEPEETLAHDDAEDGEVVLTA